MSLNLKLLTLLIPLFYTSLVMAEVSDIAEPQASPSLNLGERLENLGLIHKDDSNPVVQEFWLLGRYHGQYHFSEGSGGTDDGWEDRRFRIGAQGKFFRKLMLHAQMVSGSDFDPFYNGFTELWAQWSFFDWLNLTVGQQKHRFTHDRNISSRYINYLERSMLTNMFALDYTPALTISGTKGKVAYYTGVFSNATERNMERSFTELDSGWSYLGTTTYDLGKILSTDSLHLNIGYLHSEAKDNATNLDRFKDGLSSALIIADGAMSLVTEITGGLEEKRSHAYGINLQPGYFVTDQLQLVTRLQLAGSPSDEGLNAQRRYEREVGLGKGDFYKAVSFGANYYIARHRIKFMTGIEYAAMEDKDSWTAFTAFRFFFGPHSKGPFPMAQLLNGRY